ncbi:MAG TPA: cohesin domain-containing protein [Geobacteraceae bacterium]
MKRSLMVFFILFCQAAAAYAAATITVYPSGNGQFIVQGTGLERVAGIDIAIQYDKTTLANPKVVQGSFVSDSLMVTNTKEGGKVSIASVYAYPRVQSGTGVIAVVSFDNTGSSAANMTSVIPRLLDVNGASLPVVGSVAPIQTDPQPQPSTDTTGGTVSSPTQTALMTPTTTTSGRTTWLGGVSQPTEPGGEKEKIQEQQPAPPVKQEPVNETTLTASVEADVRQQIMTPSAEKKFTAYKSVLNRFRDFKGEKNPQALMKLFTEPDMSGIHQEPAIAFSDGKASVKVFVDVGVSGREAPNFALKGAKLVAIRREKGNVWLLEALPEEKTYEATITILNDSATTEIPLTVVPLIPPDAKIGKEKVMTENDFSLFLKERGTAKVPRYDLNGDGKRDYIDDYIFTGNYLAQLAARDKQTAKK